MAYTRTPPASPPQAPDPKVEEPNAERFAPWIVGSALFLITLDATIVSTALPTMAREFGEPILRLNGTITFYLMATAVFIPISGWLADRFGSKAVFQGALIGFIVTSALCAAAPDLISLVVARSLQGATAALITPVGRVVILQRHAKADLIRAMATLGIPIVLGPVVGPPLGGFFVQYLSWQWIFLINIPIGILAVWLVHRFIADAPAQARTPVDLVGFVLSGLSIASLVYGLAMGAETDAPVLHWLMPLLVGAALAALFVLHARRHVHPVMNLDVLAIDTFSYALIGGSLLRIGVTASVFVLALMLQLEFGLSPLNSGLVALTSAAAALMMKTTAQSILKRFGYRRALIFNTLLICLSLISWGLLRAGTPILLVIAVLFAGGFVRSLQFTALNTLAFADLAPHQVSKASGLSAAVQQLADSVGVGVCAIILAHTVQHDGPGGQSVGAISACFYFLAAVNLLALPFFVRLRANAGDELRGKAPQIGD